MKKWLLAAKIAKNGTALFGDFKNGKLQCAHFKCRILNFLAHNPLPTSNACVFHHLQRPNMIHWSLAATIKLIYLNFILILFYSVQVFKFKIKPSYISISKPINLFVKISVTLALFAWCPASGFFVPCPNLTSISTAIVQNKG
jgi:hypothetical protein